MKRIGIFVCYDKDGIVDAAEEHLMNSLAEILDRFVVVVNGCITDESLEIVKKYTDQIVVRRNEGFDGGAYQDILINHLKREEILAYDELLLANDTYYGPFFPWREAFEPMEKAGYDFWGLTRHLSYFDHYWDTPIKEHIQSYFLVFTKRVFTDERFFTYWEELPELYDRGDAILKFEVPLTEYYRSLNYSYGVYTDLFPQQEYMKRAESIYTNFCCDLLKDFRFPILKKKNGVSLKNPQTIPAIQYIKTHYDYDTDMIWENVVRTEGNGRLFLRAEEFIQHYGKIYIYGTGKTCEAIENFLQMKKVQVGGYLETNPTNEMKNGKPVIAWDNFHLEAGTGIIVAMGKNNTEEVKRFLPCSEAIMYLN